MAITLIYNPADTCFIARTNGAMLVAGVSLCAPLVILSFIHSNLIRSEGMSALSMIGTVGCAVPHIHPEEEQSLICQ